MTKSTQNIVVVEGPALPARFFRRLSLVGLVVSLAAIALLVLLKPDGIAVERVRFNGPDGGRLVGDVYSPRDGSTGLPGVLLCHGVEVSKEIMAALGVELARRDYVALAFDYGGYGESDSHGGELEIMVDDTRAALDFLSGLPRTNRNGPFAMIGHSMGVHYSAVLAANEPKVTAVVGMGNNHANPEAPPNNLALFMGVYEEFHTLTDMLEAVRLSAKDDALLPNLIAGDFRAGTARALIVSPQADHGIEPLDPYLIEKAIDWIDRAIPGRAARPLAIIEPYRLMARAVLVFSGAATILGVMTVSLISRTRKRNGNPPPVFARFHLLATAAVAIAANLATPPVTMAMSDVLMAVVLAGSVSAALAWKSRHSEIGRALALSRRWFVYGGGLILIVIAVFIFSVLVVGLGQAYSLGYLGQAPAFLFHALFLLTYEGVSMIRADIFYRYSEALIPGAVLSAVLAIELIRPGGATLVCSKVVLALVKAFQFTGPIKLGTSKIELGIAGVVLLALFYVLYTRFREGWLIGDALVPMLMVSLKAMVLPLSLFILAINLYHRKFGNELDD